MDKAKAEEGAHNGAKEGEFVLHINSRETRSDLGGGSEKACVVARKRTQMAVGQKGQPR